MVTQCCYRSSLASSELRKLLSVAEDSWLTPPILNSKQICKARLFVLNLSTNEHLSQQKCTETRGKREKLESNLDTSRPTVNTQNGFYTAVLTSIKAVAVQSVHCLFGEKQHTAQIVQRSN